MGFTIETPLSPHMAGLTTRLIARDFFSPRYGESSIEV